MTDAEIIRYLQRALKPDAPQPVFTWLYQQRRRATTLLFVPAGRDTGGLPLWTVGEPSSPVTFAAKAEAMRALHMLAGRKAIAVELVDGGAPGAEAVRLRLKRALKELREYCPALADELETFTIEHGVVRYRRRGDSPRVETALVSSPSRVASTSIEPVHEEELAT